MITRFVSKPERAFSRTDLMFTSGLLSLLAALLFTSLNNSRQNSRLRLCSANLQKVAAAILQFSADNQGTLPGLTSSSQGDPGWGYKEQVKRYAGITGESSPNDKVFACPMDRGYSDPKPFYLTPRFNFSSYVFNGVVLFGTPNIANWKLASIQQPKRTLLVMEWAAHAPLSWHRSQTGKKNAPFYKDAECMLAYVDGHVNFTKMYYDGYNAAYTRDPIPGYNYKFSGK
jgi:hypothetical protein